MYTGTDIFSHRFHVEKLNGNESCARCHQDRAAVKSRETAVSCTECHATMVQKESLVKPPEDGLVGLAAGYMEAMHGLCITCHEQKVKEAPQEYASDFAECATCHRDSDVTKLDVRKPDVAPHP
jgi:hypothetical protein